MLDRIDALVTSYAAAWWVPLVVFTLSTVDAFFPPLPSESVVIALSAISAATGEPHLLVLGVAAALGAFCGDNITYALGRHSPLRRWVSGNPRLERVFDRSGRELAKRGALAILAARYVPVGRTAVNLTAGATRFPRRRFVGLSALAALTWSVYSVAIGALAGHWVESTPLVGALVGVAGALVIGFAVDTVLNRLVHPRRARA
ncbi:DedA family protein [Kineococcus sp. SYSU DK004]|uniref:DedA family protein n=1 Tax=Kineococcus sp. SYSU DK004 TaxID=3383125 RepID=UPI003D7CC766